MILVMSPKGGVGVTTVVAELARRMAVLDRHERNIVAVDLTDQAALDYRLNGADDDGALAAGVLFRQVDQSLSGGKPRADFAMAQRAANAVVIVDVAAGDRETRNALVTVADLVLCVLGADAGSMAVLPQATQCEGVTPYCVLNMVDERRAFSADAVTILGATFGPKLLGAIHNDEAVNEALALLAEIAPGSAADHDFQSLASRVHGLLAETGVSRGSGELA